jgi:coatomer subunit beta
MDILRALNSPNVDICRKTLTVAMDLVSPRNIHEVVQVLKREVVRTQEADMEKGMIYRTLLIQAIHSCATKVYLRCYNDVHCLCSYGSSMLCCIDSKAASSLHNDQSTCTHSCASCMCV